MSQPHNPLPAFVQWSESLMALPEYLILGMSLEHILKGKAVIDKTMGEAEKLSGLAWSAWHEVAPLALKKLNAKRIGLITPFDKKGNENAEQLFKDLGVNVVSSVGFACANALHIAHVPDSAKEQAIVELLATKENKLDAVVQCGTNMSMMGVIDKLESRLQLPILGINPTLFWHALRENGITTPVKGAGRLLREV